MHCQGVVFSKMSKPHNDGESSITGYQTPPSYLYRDIVKALGCLLRSTYRLNRFLIVFLSAGTWLGVLIVDAHEQDQRSCPARWLQS